MRLQLDVQLLPSALESLLRMLRMWDTMHMGSFLRIALDAPECTAAEVQALLAPLESPLPVHVVRSKEAPP